MKPAMHELVRAARARRLYVLVSGSGPSLEYKFWDCKTGKWVMNYYPARKVWFAHNDKPGSKEGTAADYHAALAAVLDGPEPPAA